MAKLSAEGRRELPGSDFAGPKRSYPVNDAAHARAALSRVSANGSPAVKAEVRAKVAERYPSMHEAADQLHPIKGR